MKRLMKRRIITVIMTLVMLGTLCFAAITSYAGQTPPKTVKVGYYYLENCMEGASPEAAKSGLGYDVLQEIAAINNWNYEYVYKPFEELVEMLENGEIDILPCYVYSDKRAEKCLFSSEPLTEEIYYIASNKIEEKQAENPKELLEGKIIASVKGTIENEFLDEWLTENEVTVNKMNLDEFSALWSAVESNDADYALTINNTAPVGFYPVVNIGSSRSFFGVAEGKEDILNGIDDAIDLINEINPFKLYQLREQYFSQTLSGHALSEDELQWIKQHNVLKVGGLKQDPPFCYADDSGNIDGMVPAILEIMFNRLGIDMPIEWTLYSSVKDAHDALKNGEIDLFCPEYYSYYDAEQNGITISEKVTTVTMGMLFSDKQTHKEDLIIATPGTKLGIYYVRDVYPDAQVILCDNVTECIRKVVDGEATCAVAHTTVLQNFSREFREKLPITTLNVPVTICFSSNKNNVMLMKIVDRGLNVLTEGEIKVIQDEYTESSHPAYNFRDFINDNTILIIVVAAVLVGALVALVIITINHKRNRRIDSEYKAKLQEALNNAEVSNEAKSNFLFNMSHDIRTPMNAITGFTTMAKKYVDDPEKVKDYLNKIDISGTELLSLINQVLEMSRIESGKIELREEPVDLVQRFNMLTTILKSQAEARGITFVERFENVEHSHILADDTRVSQIVFNIVGNAIKFTPDGGNINMTLEEIECGRIGYANYVFTVEDTGIGMDAEFLEHIFEPFVREKSSTVSRVQGTGLGMPIVKELIDHMGGIIKIESEKGKGTKVRCTLSFKLNEDEEGGMVQEEAKELDMGALKGKRILVVEDNEMNREIAIDILSDFGILAEEAEDGDIAVEMIKNSQPGYYDFVLMDVQMPRLNGYEATRQIRKLDNKELASIKIIAVTANAFEEDKKQALDAGMDGHLAKPIDIQKLFETLADIIK